jgi:D-xylose 1-dehydrogenase (NADP+, D-xylono-1,5-lactone-forming)
VSTTAKLRWGVLGVAKINERLLPAFRKAATADLRALASRDAAKSRAAADAAGVPHAHGSYEALLADGEIDAVYIPLPNTLHAEWTRRAADVGKHVLVEKPLAPTAAEAAAVIAYCRSRGVRLMDGFMWPHHPRTAHLRRSLDSGGVGRVTHVAGAFTFHLHPLTTANIRLRPELAGGSLLDVGCYPVYGIRWAMGAEPVSAYAKATYLHGVDVALSGVLHFSLGRSAVFDCGFTAPLRGWLEITGPDGVVRVPDMWLPESARATYEVQREGRPAEAVTVDEADQIVCMLDDFGRAVREGRDPAPAIDEAVKTLKVLDALARSAREGHEVAVER